MRVLYADLQSEEMSCSIATNNSDVLAGLCCHKATTIFRAVINASEHI